jgi:hypothetical protein
MSTLDYCRAVTIGFTVFAGTLLLSIPLVAVYALLINPGQSQEFYRAAATWIAPWSSHIGGPMLFFGLTRRQTRRHPQTHPIAFAWAAIGSYVAIDLMSAPLFGLTLSTVVTRVFVLSLAVKLVAVFAGAILGARRSGATSMRMAARG